jgi:methyl-accepting chemotaxis protein
VSLSIKQKIIAASSFGILAISIAAAVYASVYFRDEITRLNRSDFRERIRNIEYDYRNLDGISGATADVNRERELILKRLHDRYIDGSSDQAYPFIVNGDRQAVLFIENGIVDPEFVKSPIVDRIVQAKNGDFDFAYKGKNYWVVFSYFKTWDWITGYILSDSQRLASVRTFNIRLFTTVFGAGIIAVLLLWLLLHRTISPLGRVSSVLRLIAEGDLTRTLEYAQRDEIGEIVSSFNGFQQKLTHIVSGIQGASRASVSVENELTGRAGEGARVLDSISERTGLISGSIARLDEDLRESSESVAGILHGIRELNDQIDEQTSAVTESSASVEEMTAALDNVAGITRQKTGSTRSLIQTAEAGGEKLSRTVAAISDIHANVDDIAELIDVIGNIASQTNLLSMNAAIEAAHAGDSGRGFAVVADEIRKLAEHAARNSSDITRIIKALVERIENAAALSSETRDAFTEINTEVHQVARSFDEISASTDQLSAGAQEILHAMSLLNELSIRVKEGSGNTIDRSRKVEESIRHVSEISALVRDDIGRIDADSKQSASSMQEIFQLANRLRETITELETRINQFIIE